MDPGLNLTLHITPQIDLDIMVLLYYVQILSIYYGGSFNPRNNMSCNNIFWDNKLTFPAEYGSKYGSTYNNNNCLKSNIQCIEIRVQWTVHLGSSHMHVHAVTRVHAVTPKLVICVMYLTSI